MEYRLCHNDVRKGPWCFCKLEKNFRDPESYWAFLIHPDDPIFPARCVHVNYRGGVIDFFDPPLLEVLRFLIGLNLFPLSLERDYGFEIKHK